MATGPSGPGTRFQGSNGVPNGPGIGPIPRPNPYYMSRRELLETAAVSTEAAFKPIELVTDISGEGGLVAKGIPGVGFLFSGVETAFALQNFTESPSIGTGLDLGLGIVDMAMGACMFVPGFDVAAGIYFTARFVTNIYFLSNEGNSNGGP